MTSGKHCHCSNSPIIEEIIYSFGHTECALNIGNHFKSFRLRQRISFVALVPESHDSRHCHDLRVLHAKHGQLAQEVDGVGRQALQKWLLYVDLTLWQKQEGLALKMLLLSVWQNLSKFRHFGKSLQVFGKFLTVFFLFGKMLSLFWQICDIIVLIFHLANDQILINNPTIWSHWN